jgi:uncharacterized damage-inducible protein DinB
MSHSRIEQYRRWFEYEKDSHRRVLGSLESVPQEHRTSSSFQKALEIVAHIAAARQIWLFRFGRIPDQPVSFFPTGISLNDVRSRLAQVEDKWTDYLGELTEADLSCLLRYQSSEGDWFQSVVEDIFAQLFGHSWYHRGQVASLVKAAGGQPAVTDFIFWSRQPLSAPGP